MDWERGRSLLDGIKYQRCLECGEGYEEENSIPACVCVCGTQRTQVA